MKIALVLAVIAAPLVAVAEPSDSVLAGVLLRQLGSGLHARSGIDPSTISKECQSPCSPIIKTLDACDDAASCECTQANFEALANCMNCLQALAPQYEGIPPAETYLDSFRGACADFNLELNDAPITATPTGIASTGDPFSIFNAPTPTSGATAALTAQTNPLLPTRGAVGAKTGSAVGFSAPRFWDAGAAVAITGVVVILSGFLL
ncbi:hypothetical protein B0F90DRAFT_1668482 [Multifurca ochricompacta]|uniref:Extracellular membrane protein CFEM domain-containing protein n=1 Tax=Multifurca ochricompacta TaxID=376703 RepID=A0AAD4QKF1_9AGAM|nr:hypothetical protein B0F90DRAFT_1668482 [Multifurca ochricompacta]